MFQVGSFDVEVKVLDAMRVALMMAAWMAMKSCSFYELLYWYRPERKFGGLGA